MTEIEIREQLRGWILERSKAPAERLGADDTPILQDGLLTSLDIVEFILFIESVRGEEVDVDSIDPDVFTSIDTLYDAFFASRAA